MARQKMIRKLWKRRRQEEPKPVFIFEASSSLKGSARKALAKSLKEQVKDGVVLLDSNTALVYAGNYSKIMVVEN